LEENSTVENNLKGIHKDKTPTITKDLLLFLRKEKKRWTTCSRYSWECFCQSKKYCYKVVIRI